MAPLPVPTKKDAISVARGQVGWQEQKNASEIMDFFNKNGVQGVDPRVTAWCAAYVDAVLGASGNEQRKSLRAADFLTYGDESKTPGAGNVVVFKPLAQGSSGHVGIVTGIEGDRVRYIGGNDGNAVAEDSLPMSKVAGFRLPRALGGGTDNAFGDLPAQSGMAATNTPMTMPDLTAPIAAAPAPEVATPTNGEVNFGQALATLASNMTKPQAAQPPTTQKPTMPAIRRQLQPIPVADRTDGAPKKVDLASIFSI